jgi:peroxiredoxin Q/BCP
MSNMAPDFTLPGTKGEVSLANLKGSAFVLFFYPRDMTAGCINEAEGFTALQGEFDALGIKLYGISKDSLSSHEKFISKKALSMDLLSDEESKVCEAFDVWKEKKMYGKTFMGIERSTFLINAEGEIVQEWRKVKVPGHAEAVLDAAKELTA